MRLNPDATFDCLFIADRLQTQGEGFTTPEIHVFSYLACLLSLYKRRSVSDWGYTFVGTELGAPFSQEIAAAANFLVDRGHLVRVGDRLHFNEQAVPQLDPFRQLNLNAQRAECLAAACASTVALSAGMVGSALCQEPDLKRSAEMPTTRQLLQESAQSQLHFQFQTLRQSLGDEGGDLRLPAVVWLTALYRSSYLGEDEQ